MDKMVGNVNRSKFILVGFRAISSDAFSGDLRTGNLVLCGFFKQTPLK